MLVAACQDYVTLSGLFFFCHILCLVRPLVPICCQLVTLLHILFFLCVDRRFFTVHHLTHYSQEHYAFFRDNDKFKTRFLVCSAASDTGRQQFAVSPSVVQRDLWTGRHQTRAVCSITAGLNQCGHIVVSWFLVILSAHSRAVLEQVHMKIIIIYHAVVFWVFFLLLLSWKPLLSSQLCLCSWRTQQDYFNTPPPQILK